MVKKQIKKLGLNDREMSIVDKLLLSANKEQLALFKLSCDTYVRCIELDEKNEVL